MGTNRGRRRHELEYELLDTGVFDRNRYFDVVVEYAKASPEDILVRITVHNRGPDAATLHLLPTLWFRNTWSWGPSAAERPGLRQVRSGLIEALPSGAGPALPARRERAGAAVHRERDQHRAPGAGAQPNPVRQGRNPQLPRPRPGRGGESRADRHQGGRALPARDQGRRSGHGQASALRQRGAGPRPRRGVREDVRRASGDPAEGGGRVLRVGHSTVPQRRRAQRDAPGAGRHALVQAVLPLRRRSLAGGAGRQPVQLPPQGDPERALAPHAECRHHLHAGQVGVPLVRGLGPGVPLPGADAGGLRLRQGAAGPHAGVALPAPQRPAPGLRVEFRRRESAGACLGHHLHLPAGEGSSRGGRPRMAGALLPAAPAQLHLVGQPEGPRREQRLRGRLPRAGQHRGLRPERTAAHRRLPRAGRRHRLDGALLPEHARDGGGAGADPARHMPAWSRSSSSTLCGSPRRC